MSHAVTSDEPVVSTCPQCRGDVVTVDSVLAKRRTRTLVFAGFALFLLAINTVTSPESALSVVAVVAALSVCVLAHEYGHLRAARRAGVLVSEFAVGFGPVLAARATRSGLVLSLRLLPLGGFCRVAGISPRDAWCPAHEGSGTLLNQTRTRTQVWVLLAGVTNNLVFAWLTLVLVTLARVSTMSWRAIQIPWTATKLIGYIVWMSVVGLWQFLTGMFAGRSNNMTSVVGMPGEFHSTVAQSHVDTGLVFMAFVVLISISVAFMNVLPLSPLDGGHVVVVLWCAWSSRVRGHLPSVRAVNTYRVATLIPLAVMTLFLFGRDLVKAFI